jgi:serine/threonine protein kinase
LIVANADRIIDLLHEAKARPAGAERERFLAETCREDAELKEQILSLLAAEGDGNASFLGVTQVLRPAIPPTEKPGDRIGRYKLLEQIGEGGCGVVYVAEQEQPVRRRVALKVIKLGMDTRQVIARFDAERQALAMMDHPNIAKVLDGGATETGRPYFVMELVRGIRITDYCDQHQLPPRERLELFIQVCRAIQHAHQKGIMHRDIKPSNILVASNDGAPVPKVIDFGIAKATQGRLTDQTVYTAFEQFIGTPAYMSPEQAEMSLNEVDTRTDIYSLGVLLYELLTGKTPFDATELVASGLEAMRRTIREKEPARPSTRLSTMMEGELTSTARQRHTEAPKLIHLLRGDLDWITMKCLEKDRTRRYETANGLASDVQRHLADEPVVARPPSKLYEFQKTVRRHKFGFGAAAALIAVLLGGIVVSRREATRALRAEQQQIRLRKQAESNEQKAQTEASKSQHIAQFLEDMIKGVSPWTAKGRDTSVLQEIMDATASHIDEQMASEPEAALELKNTLAAVYREFGKNDKAAALLRGTPEIARQLWGTDDPRVADLLNNLGLALSLANPAVAEPLHRQALSIRQKHFGTNSMRAAQVQRDLAMALWGQGKLAEAEAEFLEVLAIERKVAGNQHPELAATLMGLSQIYRDEEDFAKAETVDREALKINRAAWLNQTNIATLAALERVGDDLRAQGRFKDAEGFVQQSLNFVQALYPADELRASGYRNKLMDVLERESRWADAEKVQRDSLKAQKKLLGDAHPDVIAGTGHLALLLRRQGHLAEAEAMYRDKLRAARDATNDVEIGNALASLTLTLLHDKKFAEAEPTARELAARNEKDHQGGWYSFTSRGFLGLSLLGQKIYAEAEPLLLAAYGGMNAFEPKPANDLVRMKEVMEGLVELYGALDKAAAASKWEAKLKAFQLPASYSNSIIFIPQPNFGSP